MQVPPLQVPPFWQVTPLQASFVQDVYNTAENVPTVNNALSATRRNDFIDFMFLLLSYKLDAKDSVKRQLQQRKIQILAFRVVIVML